MNNRLDNYLGEMEARLQRLPQVDREQEITEITQHLDALIEAGERSGATKAEATESAIAQFGAARDIGSRLYQTGKRKRFAPLVEVGLFSAAFSALLAGTGWAFFSGVQAVIYTLALRKVVTEEDAHNFINNFIEPHIALVTFAGWPVHFMIGAAASALLIVRYGSVSGVYQKARQSAPTWAALTWVLYVSLLEHLQPNYFLGLAGVSFSQLERMAEVLGYLSVISALFFAWFAAYCVGRRNTAQQSGVDAVGSAAMVGPLIGLLQMLSHFVPIPWNNGTPLFPVYSRTVAGYMVFVLTGFAIALVQVFLTVQGARKGEKGRAVTLPLEQTAV